MGNKEKFTPEEIADTLRKHKGLVYASARSLHCSPQTIYNYAKRSALVRDALDEEKGMILDITEGMLYTAIQRGEGWAITLMLKTKGKDRGYGETVNHRVGGDPENPTPIETRGTFTILIDSRRGEDADSLDIAEENE